MSMAHCEWLEYYNVSHISSAASVSDSMAVASWERPQSSLLIKLNTDAAVVHRCGKAGIGVVARSSSGHIEGAWAASFNAYSDMKMVEALGFRFAFSRALKRSWTSGRV
ncbi:hypothetical protein ACH5RR_029520 [Cinchona calisaya]|uniref:RNase H type-1 domain-containing protein n=1 Tax=Cinchona calisaya TaxID=153742 RepID=A0ABD2YRW8_9GENT